MYINKWKYTVIFKHPVTIFTGFSYHVCLSECYTAQQLQQLALHTWVNAVHGKMTAINREEKYVTVNGQGRVYYDYLVLCVGQQYTLAVPSGADVNLLATTADVSMTCIR